MNNPEWANYMVTNVGTILKELKNQNLSKVLITMLLS